MKRVFYRLVCWMLVLAIAGLPALAAAVGMDDRHAAHAMHGTQSQGGDESADHAAHDHPENHAHGHTDSSQASGATVHADCVDAGCLASCSACSHCQGMPSVTGVHLLTPVAQTMSLHAFQTGPPAATLYRPPILS